jgi:hypothetical protein
MSVVTYSFGEYATVTVDIESGDMTCNCPELETHPSMNVSQGSEQPCIVTRYTAANYPPP